MNDEIGTETITIDRIEGDVAVCERDDGSFANVPLADLPNGVREGSVLRSEGGSWVEDASEQADRKERIEGKMRRLFR